MYHRSFFYKYIFLLMLFLLAFPKGGFKIAEVPITWGYLLLGISFLFYLISPKINLQPERFICLLLWLPFQLISALSIAINGAMHMGYLLSFIVSFFFLPFCFYFLFSGAIDSLDLSLIFKTIKRLVLFLAIYGISLFFIKMFFGFFIEIPFITINYADMGTLELSKSIDRGGIYKLISTYNNGNLYGICLLMLTPLYYLLETRLLKRNILRFSFLLTLSRTVWIGLFIVELLYFLSIRKKSLKSMLNITSIIVLAMIGIYYLTRHTLDRSFFDFIFDYTLGGRLSGEKESIAISFFSSHPFFNISEIVYLGMLENFGIMGLLTFIIALCSPVIIWYFSPHSSRNPLFASITIGLIGYWIIAISDGCILLIPTMCFYLFLSSLLFIPEFSLQSIKH